MADAVWRRIRLKESFVSTNYTKKSEERKKKKKNEFKWYSTSHWVKGVKWAALRCYIHKNDVPCFYLDTPFIACCGIKQQNTIKISSKYQFHRPSNRRPISNWIVLIIKMYLKNWASNSPNWKRICCEKVSDVVERTHSSAVRLLHLQRAPIDSDKYIASDDPIVPQKSAGGCFLESMALRNIRTGNAKRARSSIRISQNRMRVPNRIRLSKSLSPNEWRNKIKN